MNATTLLRLGELFAAGVTAALGFFGWPRWATPIEFAKSALMPQRHLNRGFLMTQTTSHLPQIRAAPALTRPAKTFRVQKKSLRLGHGFRVRHFTRHVSISSQFFLFRCFLLCCCLKTLLD